MSVHGEAFHLMTYECVKCKHQELLWNSRDGVTPFGIECALCGEDAFHINWQEDIKAPEYVQILRSHHAGSKVKRVFVDAKPYHQHIIDAAHKYVEEWWDKESALGGSTMRETLFPMDKDAAKEFFIKEWTKPGSPTIVTVGQYCREHITA